MKSKAEIIDALQIHMLVPDCKGCAYISEFNEEEHPCYMSLINDVVDTLSKSDFEVVEEVLTRSKEQDWNGTGFHGEYYELERLDSMEVPPIRFDGEGNIL